MYFSQSDTTASSGQENISVENRIASFLFRLFFWPVEDMNKHIFFIELSSDGTETAILIKALLQSSMNLCQNVKFIVTSAHTFFFF